MSQNPQLSKHGRGRGAEIIAVVLEESRERRGVCGFPEIAGNASKLQDIFSSVILSF